MSALLEEALAGRARLICPIDSTDTRWVIFWKQSKSTGRWGHKAGDAWCVYETATEVRDDD